MYGGIGWKILIIGLGYNCKCYNS